MLDPTASGVSPVGEANSGLTRPDICAGGLVGFISEIDSRMTNTRWYIEYKIYIFTTSMKMSTGNSICFTTEFYIFAFELSILY